MSHQETLAALKSQLLTLKKQYVLTRKQQQHFLPTVLETEPKDGEPNGGEDYCDKLGAYYGKPQSAGFQERLFSFLNRCDNASDARSALYQKAIFFEKIDPNGNNASNLLYYVKDCTVSGTGIAANIVGASLRGTFSIFMTVRGEENILQWYVYSDMNVSKKGTFIQKGTSQTQPPAKKLPITLKSPIDAYVTEVRLVNVADKSIMATQKLSEIPTGGKEYTWDEVAYPSCSLIHKKNRYRLSDGVYFLDEPMKYRVCVQILEGAKVSSLPEFDLTHEYEGVVFTIPKPKIKHTIEVTLADSFHKFHFNNTHIAAGDFYAFEAGACRAFYRFGAGANAGKYTIQFTNGKTNPVKEFVVDKSSRTGFIELAVNLTASMENTWDSSKFKNTFDDCCDQVFNTYTIEALKLMTDAISKSLDATQYETLETLPKIAGYFDNAKDLVEGANEKCKILSNVFTTLSITSGLPFVGAFVGAAGLIVSVFAATDKKKDQMVEEVRALLNKINKIIEKMSTELADLKKNVTASALSTALAKPEFAGVCATDDIACSLLKKEFDNLFISTSEITEILKKIN